MHYSLICSLKDNPEILKEVLIEELKIFEAYLKMFKKHKIKSGSLGSPNAFSYSTMRCVTEYNIENIKFIIQELEKGNVI